MLDDKLSRQLLLLDEYLSLLRTKQWLSKQEFLSSPTEMAAVKHWLLLVAMTCINIGAVLISRFRLGTFETYQDVFRVLAKHAVIDRELAERMMELARFRNLLAHVYWEVDDEQVYSIYQEDLGNIDEFMTQVEAFLAAKQDLE